MHYKRAGDEFGLCLFHSGRYSCTSVEDPCISLIDCPFNLSTHHFLVIIALQLYASQTALSSYSTASLNT